MNESQQDLREEQKFKKILDIGYIKKWAFIFIIITLIAFTSLFLYYNTEESLAAIKKVQVSYLFLALGLAFFDWLIGGYRNHIFIRETTPGISWRACFDANLANLFLGAVTPSQTGGGPAHLYVLNRRGVKLVDGIAVSVINFIATIVFFIASAGLAIYYSSDLIDNSLLDALITSGFSLFITGLSIVLISLFKPSLIGKLIIAIAKKLNALFPTFFKSIVPKAKNINDELIRYHDTMMLFIRKKPFLLPFSILITFIMYGNKYVLAYVLMIGFGLEVSFISILAIFSIIYLILYFAPSPGGSGIAEFSYAIFLAPIIGDVLVPTITILHRSFLILLPAIIGCFIMLGELKKHSAENSLTRS